MVNLTRLAFSLPMLAYSNEAPAKLYLLSIKRLDDLELTKIDLDALEELLG